MDEQKKQPQRQALKRKPTLTVQGSMTLPDGTVIEKIGIRARKQMEIMNNQRLSKYDHGVHIAAASILVNGQPIVADDLLDGFTGDELLEIMTWLNPDAKNEEDSEKNG